MDYVPLNSTHEQAQVIGKAFDFLKQRGFVPRTEDSSTVRFESADGRFVSVFWDAREQFLGFRVGHSSCPSDAVTDAELALIESERVSYHATRGTPREVGAAARAAAECLEALGERALEGDPALFADVMELRREHTRGYTGET